MKTFNICFSVWVIGAFIHWGYYSQRPDKCLFGSDENAVIGESGPGAFIWPVLAALHIAKAITKP